jgi:hypothetical protein
MEKKNPIFKKNYENYLRQLDGVDLSMCESIPGVAVDEEKGIAKVPFFGTHYQVSPLGVVDKRGKRPDYGSGVPGHDRLVLLEYLKRVEP